MITLKPEVIEKIRDSQQLKINLQATLKMSYPTMLKYLRANDPILANMNVIQMLRQSEHYDFLEPIESFLTP